MDHEGLAARLLRDVATARRGIAASYARLWHAGATRPRPARAEASGGAEPGDTPEAAPQPAPGAETAAEPFGEPPS